MSKFNLAFIRKANGIVFDLPKSSFHLTFDEIGRLNRFIASGDDVSNRQRRERQSDQTEDE